MIDTGKLTEATRACIDAVKAGLGRELRAALLEWAKDNGVKPDEQEAFVDEAVELARMERTAAALRERALRVLSEQEREELRKRTEKDKGKSYKELSDSLLLPLDFARAAMFEPRDDSDYDE